MHYNSREGESRVQHELKYFITNHCSWHGVKVHSSKTAEINKLAQRYTSQEAIRDAITRPLPPIPAPSQVETHKAKQHLQQHFWSKTEYTNTQQDLTVGW
jgi:hypothetical protein